MSKKSVLKTPMLPCTTVCFLHELITSFEENFYLPYGPGSRPDVNSLNETFSVNRNPVTELKLVITYMKQFIIRHGRQRLPVPLTEGPPRKYRILRGLDQIFQ